jgi:hypothetical protein
MKTFEKFRKQICVPKAEEIFDQYLRSYRGQGYWIPEMKEDVDVETIKSLLPEMQKKVDWIRAQKKKLVGMRYPKSSVTAPIRATLKKLLDLKKAELSTSEADKKSSRKRSLVLLGQLERQYKDLIRRMSFFSNYKFPTDHLKNRKVHEAYREKEDPESVRISNYTFLYRKILEDGSYLKDRTSSDLYLRTTLDTLSFELSEHKFYLTEDARFDLSYVLGKIEAELDRGKERMVERLTEWEERSERALNFYTSLTAPENQKTIVVDGKETTPNRELIKEHNKSQNELKEYVYRKQAEVYSFWLHQGELSRALYVLETILINEVGGVDGDDALERMDVARVVMNRLDKPKYLAIGTKEFLYPYITDVTSEAIVKSEKWLNALFKQGEFSFTYYYMSGVSKIFCPDIAPGAKKLRKQNIEIALQVLKEKNSQFHATRYFSRASMVGRIHMDTIWEDYLPYPERPGLLAPGQEKLKKAFDKGDYTYFYSFQDPNHVLYQVVEIGDETYAMGKEKGIKLFYKQRNPHYFRYFTKIETK